MILLSKPTAGSNFTLGLTTQGANLSPGQGGISACQAILGKTGTVISMSILIGGAVSSNLVMGIYSDVSGVPTALLATTAAAAISPSGVQWITQPIIGSPVLTPGTYWIAFNSQNSSTPGFYDTVGLSSWNTSFVYTGTMPTPFPAITGGGAFTTSAYVTLFG